MSQHQTSTKAGQEQALDIRRFVSLFLTNIKLVCAIIITTSLLGVIVSYALPKRFSAESTVSIEQNIVSDLVKGIAITSTAETKMRLLNVYLLSRNILEKVLSDLDMDLDATTPVMKEALIQSVRARISVQHDEKRGLFTISYTDQDPVRARDFVNTMTRRYIEENTAEKRQESYDATTFLHTQIQTFEKRIETAQVAIDAFKSQKGMYLGLNEQLLRQQIKELEFRLEDLRIRKNELTAKKALLSDKSLLSDQLRAKELELLSMRATYTERHPAVQRLEMDIKGLKELIEKETEEDREPTSRAEYQSIKVELQSIEEMEKNLNASLEQNMTDLRELPAIRTELSELERRKANEMRIYEQLVSRFGQSEVSKQMELQDKAVSFRVIDAAVTPTIHTFPKRFLFMIGGIMLGCALAGATVLGMDLFRGRIRSATDLKPYGLKILTKIPQVTPAHKTRRYSSVLAPVGCTVIVVGLVCAAALMEYLRLPYIEKIVVSVKRLFLS